MASEQREKGVSPNSVQAGTVLAEIWDLFGPKGHLHEVYYRREADRMVAEVAARLSDAGTGKLEAEWTVALRGASVTVKPDWIETRQTAGERSVLIRRIKTGRRTKS